MAPVSAVSRELDAAVSMEPAAMVLMEPVAVLSRGLAAVVSMAPVSAVSMEPAAMVPMEPIAVLSRGLAAVVPMEPVAVLSRGLVAVVSMAPDASATDARVFQHQAGSAGFAVALDEAWGLVSREVSPEASRGAGEFQRFLADYKGCCRDARRIPVDVFQVGLAQVF
jgi:hypothetical protein